jgi:excisionase family DNA binding protein
MRRPVYTTGQAAKICRVSQQTIIRCFDNGTLKGFRVPGSRFRRIPHNELEKFMRDNGIPLDGFDDDEVTVLVVTIDEKLARHLEQTLASKHVKVTVVNNAFDAGVRAKELHPRCIVVDFVIGLGDGVQICSNLRNDEDFDNTFVVAVLPLDTMTQNVTESETCVTLIRPEPEAVVTRLEQLAGLTRAA